MNWLVKGFIGGPMTANVFGIGEVAASKPTSYPLAQI